MGFNPKRSDIGSWFVSKYSGQKSVTAGAASDNALFTGSTIDRLDYDSCKVVMLASYTLASGETITAKATVYDCATGGGTYASYSTVWASTILATGASGGTTAGGFIKEGNVDLTQGDRYVEVVSSLDCSAAGTDTVTYMTLVLLGGKTTIPADA